MFKWGLNSLKKGLLGVGHPGEHQHSEELLNSLGKYTAIPLVLRPFSVGRVLPVWKVSISISHPLEAILPHSLYLGENVKKYIMTNIA